MRIKTLSIQGFKSFGERTVIELPDGIAAIVGPNGSGKSNICDALRWVMGEQSIRLLRGNRLEDVIFAGSADHKPVGMAEVSLSIDNSSGRIPVEFSEVTVTRRVFRSGESEFMVNRKPCRLRDIQELFMDTGLGRGGLSIIGQGEVGQVLSARPEERRAFIDEAAGIAKYRLRKREATVRLEQTREDLTRVTDIISEVENRLEPLRRQSEDARRWKALSDEHNALETSMLGYEYREALAATEKARATHDALVRDHEAMDQVQQQAEQTLEEAGASNNTLEQALEHAREAEETTKTATLASRHRVELAKERLERNDQSMRTSAEQLQKLEYAFQQLQEEVQQTEANIAQGREETQVLQKQLQTAEQLWREAMDSSSGDVAQIDELRRQLMELTAQKAGAESRLEGLTRLSEQREQTTAQMAATIDELSREQTQRHADLLNLQQKLKDVTAQLAEKQQSLETIRQESKALNDEKQQVDKAFGETSSALQEASARRRAFEHMEATGEGYFRGVREVLSQGRREGWRMKGAVAGLISVSDRLEHAVEIALGGAAQFVVVDDDADAKKAIDYLKNQRLGRVTFLPLSSLSMSRLSPESIQRLRDVPGVVGVASDLVGVDDGARKAIDYLLGRIVITETIDSAIAVARGRFGVSRAVSLDGDVVVPGGAMTGGSRQARGGSGLLSRNRELKQLGQRIARLQDDAKTLQQRQQQLQSALSSREQAVTALDNTVTELQWSRTTTERELEQWQLEGARMEERLERARQEAAKATEARQAHEAEVTALRADIEALARERAAMEETLTATEAGMAQYRERAENRRNQAEQLRLALAQKERDVAELERHRDRLADGLRQNEHQRHETIAQIKDGETEKSRLNSELHEALKDVTACEEAEKEAARLKERALEKLGAGRARMKEQEQSLREIRQRLAEAAKAATEVRVKLERCHLQVEQIEARFEERGQSPVAASDDEQVTDADLQRMRREVRQMKREMDRIGPVNVHSIEEYEEVVQRHAFLTEQRDDLLEAMEQLERVIRRIDRESEAKLTEVFDKLREAFRRTFVRMFGGGQADIAFTDPENPLESGIDMFVQPPGKKMQNLMALSGGEKSLAAVALLFALLDVSPIPFCLLDEVDAALDEQNIDRFRTVLLEYAQRTQFVVITHRQGTMECTERLFGVTMERPGMSKVVSINLEQSEAYVG